MPELPEVQTVVSGIQPIVGSTINTVTVNFPKLRKPLQKDLASELSGAKIISITRRAKFIVIKTHVDLIIHLGMSGKLTLQELNYQPIKHDHVIFHLPDKLLVYNDPRRFGMVSWHSCTTDLLAHYGVEPLSEAFDATYLTNFIHKKTIPIKNLIMDQKCVVGVGNIYACEALFHARIKPDLPANALSRAQCNQLVTCIKQVLNQAIKQGGTTLKDYRTASDTMGYFQQQLYVYGREGQPCLECTTSIINVKLSGRSTFYCPQCQP